MTEQYEDEVFATVDEMAGADENQINTFEPFPAGRYRMMATIVEMKESSKAGKMLAFTYQVSQGDHEGRKIFDNLCLQHPKVEVRQRALGALKAWYIACGLTGREEAKMSVVKSLEGREFWADIWINKKNTDKEGNPDPRNQINKFLPPTNHAGASEPIRQATPSQPPAQPRPSAPAPQAGDKLPWA